MNRIWNKHIRGSLGIFYIDKKMKKDRLRQFEHVQRRNNRCIIKKMGEIRVKGNQEGVNKRRSGQGLLGKI